MLEKIEHDYDMGASAYPPYINLTEEQIEWLMEQAKKVEQYERAMQLIIENTVSGHVENIAKKALEGKF